MPSPRSRFQPSPDTNQKALSASSLESWLKPSEALGLNNCDREPIHIPGSIQPHGALLVLNDAGKIIQTSANLQSFLGPGADIETVAAQLNETIPATLNGQTRQIEKQVLGKQALTVISHRSDTLRIFELEPVSDTDTHNLQNLLCDAVAALSTTQTALESYQIVVAAVRQILGYDRVLAYMFEQDGHGKVVAESSSDGQDRFLGLHFPATDIPQQARRLYLIERTRQITDVMAASVPVEPAENPVTGRPLNMAYCHLRSVSPIHLEYLKNMAVQASFSASVIVQGELVGLIACHHNTPRFVSVDARQACEVLGYALSDQLVRIEEQERKETLTRALNLQVTLVSELGDQDALHVDDNAWSHVAGIVDNNCFLIALNGVTRTVGTAPETLEKLWYVGARLAAESSIRKRATANIEKLEPDCVGGLLTIPIGEAGWLGWYRQPVESIVEWAGEPAGKGNGVLEPRASFETWKEHVSGQSKPFTDLELEIAESLHLGIAARLGYSDRFEEVHEHTIRQSREYVFALEEAHATLRRVNEDLRQFAHAASHDLKGPLRTVRSFLPMVEQSLGERLSGEPREWLHYVKSAIDTLARLQEGLWAFSRVGREADVEEVDVNTVVQRVLGGLATDLDGAVVTVGDLPKISGVPGQIETLFRNLIANACKFRSSERGLYLVIDARREARGWVFSVADNGIGFPESQSEKIFSLFSRLHPDHPDGDGLGLALCRRIAHHHQGWITATSEGGYGATFEFNLNRPKIW